MARDKLIEYDQTAANNTVIGDVNTSETMLPSEVNDAIREQMSHLADFAAGTQPITKLATSSIDANGGTIKLDGNYPVGTGNVALGNTALDDGSLSGSYNTAVGSSALTANTSGQGNTATGYTALLVNSTGNENSAFGQYALYDNTSGSSNVAVGRSALENNTTASANTAVGYQAGYGNTTGANNVFVGDNAGTANTTGAQNTFVGRISADANTTGIYNTTLGYWTLSDNSTGSYNTSVGASSLKNNTTASYNTAVGYQAGYYNTTGYENVSIGTWAGYSSTTARAITAVGYTAGYNVTTAQYGCFVGRGAGASVTTGTANNFFGANASALGAGYYVTTGAKNTIIGGFDGNQGGLDIRTSNNNIVLSDGDGNPRLYINNEGKVNIGSPLNSFTIFNCRAHTGFAYAANFQVRTNGYGIYLRNASDTVVGTIIMNASSTNYNTTSDYRLKENVIDLTGAADRVQQLNPSRFNFIEEPDNTVDGFLAHEVASIVPEAVTGEKDAVDDDGNIVAQAIDQSKLVPLLTAALQEALTKIDQLETRIAALETN